MIPLIDRDRTSRQLRRLMAERGLTVRDVQDFLSLSCVQSIYHWLDGRTLPTVDNLYALSELLQVPMDLLIAGDRKYQPSYGCDPRHTRLLSYFRQLGKRAAI